MTHWHLLGIFRHALVIDNRYETRATKNMLSFRSRVLPEATIVPQLRRFPVPVQQLMAKQIREASKRVDDGEDIYDALFDEKVEYFDDGVDRFGVKLPLREIRTYSSPTCECRFFRRWQLPCCHVFQHHITYGSLTD